MKKTTKTESVALSELEKVVDSRSLVLKSALRETNTLTYNPDGSILQFQQIQEEAAQAEAVRVLDTEHASTKKELLLKESTPSKVWVILGLAVIVLLAAMWYVQTRLKIR
ncbi:MAG TPA: hypothetical protein VF679_03155 [Pedobacter sp.]